MKNKSFKRQVGIFITSFFLTACVIIFSVSGILIEQNTGKMLGKAIETEFSFRVLDNSANLTVNDREYTVSVKELNDLVTSKSSVLLSIILLVI